MCFRRIAQLVGLLLVGRLAAAEPLIFVASYGAGDKGAITAFRLDESSGTLREVNRLSDPEYVYFLALAPGGKTLYAIHGTRGADGTSREFVSAYRVAADGALEHLGAESAQGTSACFVACDPRQTGLVLANYKDGTVVSFPLTADGKIKPSASLIQHRGSSIDTDRQEGPHAHATLFDPSGQWVYAPDLGADTIFSYRIDPKTAELTPTTQHTIRTQPGAGPRHLRFHPTQPWVYGINELENSVNRYDFDPAAGTLTRQETISTLPADFEGKSWCADLAITPDGRFLYGTNRGHDSIAAYRIGERGMLELLEITPSGGKTPQNLAITPDGRMLLVANMSGANIAVFGIDGATGKLSEAAAPYPIAQPACIVMAMPK